MIESETSIQPTRLPKAAIALGENIKIGINPQSIRENPQHLSIYSKEVAIAAAVEHHEKRANIIIFSEGYTAGEGYPSGAKAMADYAKEFYLRRYDEELPEEHILLEEKSKDTSTQAEELKTITDNKYKITSVIAASFHLRRTKGIFKAFKNKVENYISAEEIVSSLSSRHKSLMKKQTGIFNYKLWPERVKEFGLNSARYVLFDPGQKRLRWMTQKSRG